ncbi:PREDICTED: tumor necrosis factor receptor superfamily member 4 [Pseudopodoces humilis]|uniref:tumor necrosis factor receptor superfamily member 4 n=1 Tax=Pseudopodoces humilis TaxID=181119 RepID=UPI0006B773CC|nr:PREDICTED: tumor necrosis factor receptor superfamily member 4 [Pseudopodoces humilis]
MAGTALPRIPWNFPALCWLLAVPIPGSLSLECREHQYRFHDKCCSDCPPGQRMRRRCTAWADTECSPCQDGYFSSQHHHGFCRSCTVCQTWRGSEEVKPCERSSDRRCQCRAGFAPSGNAEGSECSRCPEGTFSRGGNENCQPWTNCSFFGKSTLRAGSATEDALCSSPGLDPIPTGFLENRDPVPTAFPENRDSVPTAFPESSSNTSGPREIPAVCQNPGSPAEPGWGSLSLFLLCLVLLTVSGISILLLLIQAARKKTRNGPGRSIQHKEGSCRIPVQEEHLDPNSSLTKN